MTLWLANLAAYSVQLGVLVASAILALALLPVNTPRVTLRFWQAAFAVGVVWPFAQVLAAGWSSDLALPASRSVFTSDALWNAAPGSVFDLQGGIMALDARLGILLSAVLAAGVVLRLGYLGLGLIELRKIRRTAEPAPGLAAVVEALQRELRVEADVRFSDAVDSPATTGGLRAVVLVPRLLQDLAPSIQRAVLCHELVHVRRRDWLPVLAEELWCALFWFNPAARALASRVGLARETLVDECAIAHTGDRRAYAAALLAFSSSRVRLQASPTFIGRRHLENRIALIAQEVPMAASTLAARLVIITGIVALATSAATLTLPISATLEAQSGKVYKTETDKGVTLPTIVREVKPEYTPAALQARIQGSIFLSVVVLDTGEVGDVTVTESLDPEHGLDDNAVLAARQWRFKPGTKDGKPVAVEVAIQMTFTLK
jgi:TonB family protein